MEGGWEEFSIIMDVALIIFLPGAEWDKKSLLVTVSAPEASFEALYDGLMLQPF